MGKVGVSLVVSAGIGGEQVDSEEKKWEREGRRERENSIVGYGSF